MSTEEYKQLWQETIRKCEMESNKKEAQSFISHYFDKRDVFDTLDDKNLLQTFVVGIQVIDIIFHDCSPFSLDCLLVIDDISLSPVDRLVNGEKQLQNIFQKYKKVQVPPELVLLMHNTIHTQILTY
jgi:hypothetical protein